MCTLVGRRHGTNWVVASNSDNPYTTRNRVVCGLGPECVFVGVEVVAEPGGRAVPWAGMLTRGVNSAGLAFTYAYVPTPGDDRYPAQRWTTDLVGSAATSGQAADRIRRIQDEVLPGNYVVADAAGKAVVAEVGPAGVAVVEPEDDVLACANVWAELGSDDAASMDLTSGHRASRGRELAGTVVDGAGSVTAIMRDHVGGEADPASPRGRSVCNHGREYGTISSEILPSEQRALWWTYGHPCGGHKGNENDAREPWRRYVRFDVDRVSTPGPVTGPDGAMTPLGVRLIGEVESSGRPSADELLGEDIRAALTYR